MRPHLVSCTLALLTVFACAEPQVRLVLAPVSSAAPDLADRVKTIQVVVSSREGLANVKAAGKRPGGGEAVDWDGDGRLEIVFTVARSGPTLQQLAIDLGDNQDRALEFRVLGFAGDPRSDASLRPIAFGGAARPAGDGARQLGVPFDLRASERPPSVLLVLPANGASGVPGSLKAVTLVFSTTIEPSSVAGAVHLRGPGDREVPFTTNLATSSLDLGTPMEEQRSVLAIEPEGLLFTGSYTVSVTSSLTGASDPHRSTVPFSSTFETLLAIGCSPPYCICTCQPGYHCPADGSSRCVPDAEGCTVDGDCGSSYLCFEGQCVADCRGQLCPLPRATCGADGICR